MRRRRFEALVREALDGLPADIISLMDNIDLVVEDWPTDDELARSGVAPGHSLFGLYVGVPLTERTSGYHMVLPDKIIIYQGPIESWFRSYPEVVEQVRRTVIHEIAHHFGISDARLVELGWA
jgi:predicted Zn-dependent protease with MMP-like domain